MKNEKGKFFYSNVYIKDFGKMIKKKEIGF